MKLSKKLLVIAFLIAIVPFANAQKKLASPAETVSGKINGASITINYGSPSVKERKIWGGLVPFNQVWRAGANEATTIETDKSLTIEGVTLPAGKYSFFIIPSETESTIIFNKEPKQWGAYDYKEKNDQLRVKIKQQAATTSTEKLAYFVNPNDITLSWEKWNFVMKVQ
ncbi:DUF2911 domain-containing protein [Flavobacterium restrictum]|uniref:DUF2911 domain-containing protein n=1 Tax=Flavobacterium restrictum TaxID=2594428 RepID=A0A553EDC3_9FLAO|nr:DUF2911 domain-containing protein [Flavobacterium restrictum]TRX42941.1 DUF2911 domain-containing protein [Flavobacterium restrictum]